MPAPPPRLVRLGVLSDLDVLVAGNAAMARETEGLALHEDTLRAGVRAVLAAQADGFYLLCCRGALVEGQLMVSREWSDWRNAWVWWIQSVYVWPAHRRQGVYADLYADVQARAQAAGAAGLRLYVDARNEAAQATYAALGMDGGHYRVFEHMRVTLPLARVAEGD